MSLLLGSFCLSGLWDRAARRPAFVGGQCSASEDESAGAREEDVVPEFGRENLLRIYEFIKWGLRSGKALCAAFRHAGC